MSSSSSLVGPRCSGWRICCCTLSPEDQAIAGTGLQIGVVHDEYADEHEQGDFLIRSLVRVDSERRALVIADDVQVGQTVSFQLRDAAAASCRPAANAGPVGQVDGTGAAGRRTALLVQRTR